MFSSNFNLSHPLCLIGNLYLIILIARAIFSWFPLSEGSPFMQHLFDGGLPAKIHMTSIGASDDVVVPANHISAPGADEIVVDVAGVSDHHNIPSDPEALRAVRAALDHKPLPCTSLVDGLRSALEPVVFSRVAHDLGQYGGGILKGPSGT